VQRQENSRWCVFDAVHFCVGFRMFDGRCQLCQKCQLSLQLRK
jgi:hypothetical protein